MTAFWIASVLLAAAALALVLLPMLLSPRRGASPGRVTSRLSPGSMSTTTSPMDNL